VASTLAPTSFDDWRARFHEFSDEEQRDYNDRLGQQYPDQNHANVESCRAFFRALPDHPTVYEVGGWTGRLADAMLEAYCDIVSWTNVETNELAVREPEPTSHRYFVYCPDNYFWWREPGLRFPGDVLVACHALEHFPADDVAGILACFPSARYLHLEVPLPEGRPDWTGYHGTHILELGWAELEGRLADDGWQRFLEAGDVRSYRRLYDDDPGARAHAG
jgi:hypothetical protein